MLRVQRGVQVEEREGHADHLGGEPDFSANRARPGQAPEAEEQRERRVLPLGAGAAVPPLHPPHQPVEQRDVERGERDGERHVVECEPCQRDERHHQESRKGREGHIPAAVLEDPVVQVGGPRGEVKLAAQERVGLVHEVRRLRLVPEHRSARERIGEEAEDEEREIDAVGAGEVAPAGSAHAFPGGAA